MLGVLHCFPQCFEMGFPTEPKAHYLPRLNEQQAEQIHLSLYAAASLPTLLGLQAHIETSH